MPCIICNQSHEPIISLRNNWKIHENCMQLNYENEKSVLKNKINNLIEKMNNLKPNLSFLDHIFGNKKEYERVLNEKNLIQMEIHNLESKIAEFQKKENDFNIKYSNIISESVKYWPGYPPSYFWNELRLESINRAKGRCSECKSKKFGTGHVHHRYPLSKGGLNEINNLIYLCYDCHQRRHPHPFGGNGPIKKIGIKRKYSSLTIKEKLELALSMNQKIWIKYIDNKNELTERWIKIDKIFSDKFETHRIWIEAYCFLRDDTRNFRIDGILEASVRNKIIHNEIEFDI